MVENDQQIKNNCKYYNFKYKPQDNLSIRLNMTRI